MPVDSLSGPPTSPIRQSAEKMACFVAFSRMMPRRSGQAAGTGTPPSQL